MISPAELAAHLGDPDWAVVDCRYQLADLGFGRRAYAERHIAGAVFADLLDDLSGPVVSGTTGRHPLPDVATLAAKLAAWGIDGAVQVVAYDDRGGAMAARLWWLLRWLSHERVAVLDDTPWLGGQIWRGQQAKPSLPQAQRWIGRFRLSGATVLDKTSAIASPRPGVLLAEHLDGPREVRWQKLILATGARELFLPFRDSR